MGWIVDQYVFVMGPMVYSPNCSCTVQIISHSRWCTVWPFSTYEPDLSQLVRVWAVSVKHSLSAAHYCIQFGIWIVLVRVKQMRHAVVELGNTIEPSCWYRRFCVALRVTSELIKVKCTIWDMRA